VQAFASSTLFSRQPPVPLLVPLSSIVLLAASPSPDPIDMHVQLHGEPCPGADLRARVRAQLGESGTLPEDLEIDGVLRRRDDAQWELELAITRGDAEPTLRSFVAPHCETAIDAGALVVALAIDPSRGGGTPHAAEVPLPPTMDDDAPAIVAPDVRTSVPAQRSDTREPVRPSPRPRRIRGLVRAGGGVDGGGLPGAAVLFEGAAGALGRGWRVEVTGAYRLQSTVHAKLDPAVGGHFSLWTFGLRGCGVPSHRRIEIPLCVAAEAGQMIAEGFGFDGARTARRPWAALAFVPGLAWVIRPNIALVVQAALGVPLVRTITRVDGLERLDTVGPAYGRGLIGLEGRFP
jgi:hypothetical protein